MIENDPVIHLYDQEKEWEEAVLDFITKTIADTLAKKDHCSISLSGGSTPHRIYELLAISGSKKGIRWSAIRLYWGDERSVPHDHPGSNFRMVKEALLDHIDIRPEHVFPVQNPEHPEQAAKNYDTLLRRKFENSENTFDLCLLGMGGDGHTASIFPHTPLIDEKEAWVKEVFVPSQDTYRISVTAPVLNRSAKIAFLVKGGDKAQALKEVLRGMYHPSEYPSQLIRRSPDVHYFLDSKAASLLSD